MRLPADFITEMTRLWAQFEPEGSLEEFLAAHDQPSASGIRANGIKTSPAELRLLLPDLVEAAVPWSEPGFYTPETASPGRLPHYHAGLFYIQEPSAMLPAEILAAQPGDLVLDLCAAPGGKSTRLAAAVGSAGLLWSNEINGDRAKALLRNLELAGADRAIITQETPERLARQLPDFFDRILVDAPCSGSGMFRRDPKAAASWERYGPAACTPVQTEILDAADRMLKPGGYLVYSTCSFSLAEDEAMISQFVQRHPDYEIVAVPARPGISPGLLLAPDLDKTVRIWPHLVRGDGHYCALLHKRAPVEAAFALSHPERPASPSRPARQGRDRLQTSPHGPDSGAAALACFQDWARATLSEPGLAKFTRREQAGFYRVHQDRLHLVPCQISQLDGLHWVKTGLYLGQTHAKHKNRPKPQAAVRSGPISQPALVFEPAHALALTLEADDFQYALRLEAQDPALLQYLRGETVAWPEALWPASGWPEGAFVAVCLGRFPLGWAKAQNRGQLKNLYPPGWRKLS